MATPDSRPCVAILIPMRMRQNILSSTAEADLSEFASVTSASTANEQAGALDGAVACITGWGTPPLTLELLRNCPELKLVAHTAGSIHKLVPEEAMRNGLLVSHAAAVIASSVAELVIGLALRHMRSLDRIDQRMRTPGTWHEIRESYPGHLLGERVVGVVGTGNVGRTVIRLFRAFGCRVLASDPFLTDEMAGDLGVERVELNEIFSFAEIVTLHAPALPETTGMVGPDQLAAMKDGSLLINTSRGALVQEEALLAELRSGRISAALDVFAVEPLPDGNPLRELANVYLSPHTAGHTLDTHLRQGQAMVDEVRRLIDGEALRYVISPENLTTMA